jgi:undecaprenyl-diphosphatase
MALWFAAVLGVVQGLTEFLPVSSTAHLKIARVLFGQDIPEATYTAYIAVLQLGTLAAVIIYFARDLANLTVAMLRQPASHDGKLPWMLALGTLPIVIAGLAFRNRIEHDLNSLYIICGALIVIGILMAVIDHAATGREGRTIATLTYRDALIVGLAQALAVVPGVSRSGATICMALLLGFTRSDAARFSFLLSIPAVAGAGILEARKAFELPGAVPAILVGCVTAGVTGYAAIAWLLRWLGSHQLIGFAIYRIACGVALLAAVLAGLISAV